MMEQFGGPEGPEWILTSLGKEEKSRSQNIHLRKHAHTELPGSTHGLYYHFSSSCL